MRIVGKRASEFSNQELSRMIRTRRVYYHGKCFSLNREMIAECLKVLSLRDVRIRESIILYAIESMKVNGSGIFTGTDSINNY